MGNVFLTILICTVVLKLLTVFSDIKTRKSGAALAAIQPEIDKIQKKYKENPQKAQAEQAKLMKKAGVSMWGSCLPMLITMPLFFCFIAAFRFWGYEMTIRLLTDENSMELFKSFKFLWINNIWEPDNGLSPVIANASAFLNESLKPTLDKLLFMKDNTAVWEKLVSMGIAENVNGVYGFLTTEAAQASYNAAMQPFVDVYAGYNNGWFILPLLAGGTNLLSAVISTKSQPQNANGKQNGKAMMYIFPIMSFIFCLSYNAAFAIYWTISSICMIISNLILNKLFPRTGTVVKEAKN
ncbi:MAG: YidC/Oxa1 family membrane protein insertase [Clostridia bacterium]|nr:YidC/Oxa1 family membrane protein insertase [Clostridia bacterium]